MFIPAFTTNVMTSDFLSSIYPGWVVMILDSHRMVVTFLSWLNLLGVALAFLIFILKIFKLLPNYLHRVTDIESFEKHLESSSGHTLSFYLNFVKYRSKNMFLKKSLTRSSTVIYKLRRVKCEANFVSSGSKIVKRTRCRKYDRVITERTIGLVLGPSTALYRSFLKHCTLTNTAMGTIWRDLSKQRRTSPDLRLFWLLVGTPLVLGPELASRRLEHSLLWRVSLHIFDILFLSPYMFV